MKNWKDFIVSNKDTSFELGNIWNHGNNLVQIIKEIDIITNHFSFDYIAGIETKGIIFASALSYKTGKPLIIFRKKGKILHTKKIFQENFINWKNKNDGIEIEEKEMLNNKNILVIDDITQTLATFIAVKKIINKTNSKISAFLSIANLSDAKEIENIKIYSLFNKEEN